MMVEVLLGMQVYSNDPKIFSINSICDRFGVNVSGGFAGSMDTSSFLFAVIVYLCVL